MRSSMLKKLVLGVAGSLSLVLFVAQSANAQDASAIVNSFRPIPSPQHFALDIKVGPYIPNIDHSQGIQGGITPFSDIFGVPDDPKGGVPSWTPSGHVEFDYQFSHRGGTWGVGISIGYFRETAASFKVIAQPTVMPPAKQAASVSCTVTGVSGGARVYSHPALGSAASYDQCVDYTNNNVLNILPISLLFVYRFDILDTRYHIPLIPYIRVGIAYYAWWYDGANPFIGQYSNVATAVSQVGNSPIFHQSGGSWGLVIHPGLAINLSGIDRSAGASMDKLYGINRISAFIELNEAWINGFGSDSQLDLSATLFTAGVSIEF